MISNKGGSTLWISSSGELKQMSVALPRGCLALQGPALPPHQLDRATAPFLSKRTAILVSSKLTKAICFPKAVAWCFKKSSHMKYTREKAGPPFLAPKTLQNRPQNQTQYGPPEIHKIGVATPRASRTAPTMVQDSKSTGRCDIDRKHLKS